MRAPSCVEFVPDIRTFGTERPPMAPRPLLACFGVPRSDAQQGRPLRCRQGWQAHQGRGLCRAVPHAGRLPKHPVLLPAISGVRRVHRAAPNRQERLGGLLRLPQVLPAAAAGLLRRCRVPTTPATPSVPRQRGTAMLCCPARLSRERTHAPHATSSHAGTCVTTPVTTHRCNPVRTCLTRNRTVSTGLQLKSMKSLPRHDQAQMYQIPVKGTH